jgi:hypothetical protein
MLTPAVASSGRWCALILRERTERVGDPELVRTEAAAPILVIGTYCAVARDHERCAPPRPTTTK